QPKRKPAAFFDLPVRLPDRRSERLSRSQNLTAVLKVHMRKSFNKAHCYLLAFILLIRAVRFSLHCPRLSRFGTSIILATRPVELLLLDDHWRSESALHAFGERWMSSAPSPLRGESGRLAASFGRVPIAHPPLPRPADLPAAGAQAGPAL